MMAILLEDLKSYYREPFADIIKCDTNQTCLANKNLSSIFFNALFSFCMLLNVGKQEIIVAVDVQNISDWTIPCTELYTKVLFIHVVILMTHCRFLLLIETTESHHPTQTRCLSPNLTGDNHRTHICVNVLYSWLWECYKCGCASFNDLCLWFNESLKSLLVQYLCTGLCDENQVKHLLSF